MRYQAALRPDRRILTSRLFCIGLGGAAVRYGRVINEHA